MAPPAGPLIALVSGVPLVILGGLLLAIRPRRSPQLFFGLFAAGWGLQVVASNLGLVLESAAIFRPSFLLGIALAAPTTVFLAQFAAVTHGGRWAWLLPTVTGAVAAAAVLVLLADPSLVLEAVAATAGGGVGEVTLGSLAFPLFALPLFGTLYLTLAILYQRYRRAPSGSPRHRYRLMVGALALFTTYHALTNLSIFLGLFTQPRLPTGWQSWLASGLFLSGTLVAGGIAAHLWHRPPAPEGRDRGLLFAFLIPAGVALVTEMAEPLREPFRSWGLWRLLAVALLAHAVARYQLFDLDLRLKRVAGPAVAALVLFTGALLAVAVGLEGASELTTASPLVVSGAAAGMVLASRQRVGEALFPGAVEDPAYLRQRKLEVYEAALEQVVADGGDPHEDAFLEDLRERLGIQESQHRAIAFQLAGAAQAPASVTPSSHRALGPVVPGGTVAGRYHVDRLLGEGAHGRAMLAYDEEDDREVVLKVVGKPVLGGRAARMLLDEASTLSGIAHPNVVRVHDVLEGAHEVVLVLEYADGGSLQALLDRRGRLPLDEATTLLEQVLSGLEAAHQAGVVHRDVKPANVLLSREGEARLADFGVARQRDREATAVTAGPMGTLLYMAPEQVRHQDVGPAADLYAAAVVFHEVLTGRFYLPIAGKDDFQVRRMILEEEPTLRVDDQPAWVRELLERALAKDPEDRFASAEEMRGALGGARTVVVPVRV